MPPSKLHRQAAEATGHPIPSALFWVLSVENMRDFVWKIYYWDLRALNNAKPYFFLNEMNKKDLPAMYSTALWCLFVVLLGFLALLRNHCYSFHRTKNFVSLGRLCRGLWWRNWNYLYKNWQGVWKLEKRIFLYKAVHQLLKYFLHMIFFSYDTN